MSDTRPWVPPMPRTWWMKRRGYVLYMIRELTCVWIGAYVITLVVGIHRLGAGEEAWAAYVEALGSLPGLVFQALALVFMLYHTITWFHLAPRTMVVRIRGARVNGAWIEAFHYLLWVAVSAGIIAYLGGSYGAFQ